MTVLFQNISETTHPEDILKQFKHYKASLDTYFIKTSTPEFHAAKYSLFEGVEKRNEKIINLNSFLCI